MRVWKNAHLQPSNTFEFFQLADSFERTFLN